ncbi:Flp family type IVb pilin [Solidesulfovibrio magneticus]|jgi:pilus assembly protein Flp/PilA|uniref:Flp/Fap pilin component family protein n=1 Tax=Solidesulfovibrio magneticus (strain ATCC 700980 / DSM 13731 / RS-1) TaxID=573370 RepID=C4XIW5_SOLM1|nr:Flp family type IVb pilin [Solidesulfovibrio magneticus]BAH74129.1 Flp/Fap pilin component family protein [Solidesulfovibrio magneticus RS-1]BAH74130.1 Flp/Fap pilin component family protein [Solidesulfovibrio magneticus RS-1]BAH74131.1 Flp/Fap pilin component family protein [Solidesulfovibrio magneticus RS-1]BAH74132.1 Flp/Fap pilin component family protein [Solidesulfovibrio magneticus RS-1]BAH74133.1 Flp/Fap pilin component family protein [Solidesulfovibrio magneticus RS-1]
MLTAITQFIRDEEGATAVEYGLMAALIAAVIITAVTSIGTNLTTTFNTVATSLGS